MKCLPASAAVLLALVGLSSAQTQTDGAEKQPCEDWKYANSKPLTLTGSSESSAATGQYSSGDPFHEVVRFYVTKSGFEPPNWKILGRQFPGDEVKMPGFWVGQDGERNMSLLHHIRDGSASFTLLVTDHLKKYTVTVAITRGERDKKTYIQIIWHRKG